MRKPLPCKSCITFPICRSMYMQYRPTYKEGFIKRENFLHGYDMRFLTSLKSRCSIIKQYFNNYLKTETFYYRRKLIIDYYETPNIKEIKDE